MDLGAGRRGVDMGPSAVRLAGLNDRLTTLGYQVKDYGNVMVQQPEAVPVGEQRARYLPQITETCVRIADRVEASADAGEFPIVLGGDHSIAVGTISGMSHHFRKRGNKKMGVIWIDAHADMNTPAVSPSGNIHGMPLACMIGLGPRELTHIFEFAPKVEAKNVVLIGLRSVDAEERKIVKQSGVRAYTMREIDERGYLREVGG